MVLTGCSGGAHCACLSGPFWSSFSLLLTCSPGTWEPCKADVVFLALTFHTADSACITEEQGKGVCSRHQGTSLYLFTSSLGWAPADLEGRPILLPHSFSDTSDLSLDILFYFLSLVNSGNSLTGLSLLENKGSSSEAMSTHLTTYLKAECREKKQRGEKALNIPKHYPATAVCCSLLSIET